MDIQIISPVRAFAQAENDLMMRDQMRRRNAMLEAQGRRADQQMQMEQQRMEAEQARAQAAQRAVIEEQQTAWIKNAIGIARAQPQAIPVLMRQAKARGLVPAEAPDTLSPQELDALAMHYGIAPAEQAPQNKIGAFNPGDYTPESFAAFMQGGDVRALRRYVTPAQDKIIMVGGVPTAFDPRSRETLPLSTPEAEAEAARRKAAATAGGAATGKARAEASADLPRVESNAEDAIKTLDALLKSPGFNYLYGAYSLAPIVPGTKQADADALLQQVGGDAFLEAFNTLKGGGQITEKEGEKATAAITRLGLRRQQPSAARQAAKDLREIVARGVERARQKAGTDPANVTGNRVVYDINGNRVK